MRTLRIVGFLTALALAGALPAAGQSLAEAARKEKERQQAAQKQGKTVKTYTSEDLAKKKAEAGATAGTAPTTAPSAPTAASTPAAPAAPAAGETPEQIEKKWVEKYKAIKMEIQQKRERIQALQNELNQLTTGLMGAWSPDQSQAVRDAIVARQEEIKKLEAEIRAKEAELDKVVRDARREGVPPGAFRKADRELEAARAPQKP